MEPFVWALLFICVLIIGGVLFLYKRGALSVDRKQMNDVIENVKEEVSKFKK